MKSWCYQDNKLRQFGHLTCSIPSLQKFDFLDLILRLYLLIFFFNYINIFIFSRSVREMFAVNLLSHVPCIETF